MTDAFMIMARAETEARQQEWIGIYSKDNRQNWTNLQADSEAR
jgi:hypothetical protein